MRTNYLFPCPSSLGHYKAKAVAVICFDKRFRRSTIKFLNSIGNDGMPRSGLSGLLARACGGVFGWQNYDLVSFAGGAKSLFDPEDDADKRVLLKQIRLSVKLHATEEAWFFTHADCGACGGRARFDNNPDAEIFDYHSPGHRDLRERREKDFPEIKNVRTFFVDEKGVIETTDF